MKKEKENLAIYRKVLLFILKKYVAYLFAGARGGSRTHISLGDNILSVARIPIPPPGHWFLFEFSYKLITKSYKLFGRPRADASLSNSGLKPLFRNPRFLTASPVFLHGKLPFPDPFPVRFRLFGQAKTLYRRYKVCFEATGGIEPPYKSFADPCLTTWLRGR